MASSKERSGKIHWINHIVHTTTLLPNLWHRCNNFTALLRAAFRRRAASDIISLLAVYTFYFRAVSRRAAARRGRSYAYEEEKPDSAARASACGVCLRRASCRAPRLRALLHGQLAPAQPLTALRTTAAAAPATEIPLTADARTTAIPDTADVPTTAIPRTEDARTTATRITAPDARITEIRRTAGVPITAIRATETHVTRARGRGRALPA